SSSLLPRTPLPPLFPYTTLFRSLEAVEAGDLHSLDRHRCLDDVGGKEIFTEAQAAGLEETSLLACEDLFQRLFKLRAEVAALGAHRKDDADRYGRRILQQHLRADHAVEFHQRPQETARRQGRADRWHGQPLPAVKVQDPPPQ